MKKKLLAGLAVGVMMLGMAGMANANIIIYEGLEGGSGDVNNVLFNDINAIKSGATVTGSVQQTGDLVKFIGDGETLTTPANGQARIEAVDGKFSWIEIMLDDPTKSFSKIQFNINADADGQVTLSFLDQLGTNFTETFDVDGNGENKFTAIGVDDQMIVSATIASVGATGISDLKQIRLGSTDGSTNPVPEPATMLLMGTGLAGLIGARRKKKA